MRLLLYGRPSFTPITNNVFVLYCCIILLSIFIFPVRGFYLLSPFVFSSIFPSCLILNCFLAKGSLSLEYPALSLLEEAYCQRYISTHYTSTSKSLLNSGTQSLKHGASSVKRRKSSSLRHTAPRI
jgi:hypothetical protein